MLKVTIDISQLHYMYLRSKSYTQTVSPNVLNKQKVPINKAVSKTIYDELRNRVITIPSAQKKCSSYFTIDSHGCICICICICIYIYMYIYVYSFPHCFTSDTKLHEFQFKLFNRYLAANHFLCKFVLPSPLCSLYGGESESLKLILIFCDYVKKFWVDVMKWLCNLDVYINNFHNREVFNKK